MARYIDDDYEDAEAAELRADDRAARARAARWNHLCETCLGNLGPGSPCAPEEDEQQEVDHG